MSKFTYAEIKPALKNWEDDKKDILHNESQRDRGIQVGYFAPSGANWAYTMHSEVLDHKEYGKILALTIRQFGSLSGIISFRKLDYLMELEA